MSTHLPATISCCCCGLKVAAFWPSDNSTATAPALPTNIYCPRCTHEIHTLLDYLKHKQPNFHPKIDINNATMNILNVEIKPTPCVSFFIQQNELFISDLQSMLDSRL